MCTLKDFFPVDSDESNDKVTKKELLIGKRKDKKDNKKDRGYAALEGESSAEEDCEAKWGSNFEICYKKNQTTIVRNSF